MLSALDSKTEKLVVGRVLGRNGLPRKLGTTAILVTHSSEFFHSCSDHFLGRENTPRPQANSTKAQHFHLAEKIVMLGGDGKIAQAGTYDTLRSQSGYISSILLKPPQHPGYSNDAAPQPMTSKLLKEPSDDDVKDLSRKTGDMAVYGTSR